MLIVTREVGQSILLGGRVQATIALIGAEYVEVGLFENDLVVGRVTLVTHERRPLALGVTACLVSHPPAGQRVRLGFEYPSGVAIERV